MHHDVPNGIHCFALVTTSDWLHNGALVYAGCDSVTCPETLMVL